MQLVRLLGFLSRWDDRLVRRFRFIQWSRYTTDFFKFNSGTIGWVGFSSIINTRDLLVLNKIDNPFGCHWIITPHVFFYILEKQNVYLFLYDRAKIVHDSLTMDAKRAKYLSYFRWILWLTIIFGFALCFYWYVGS